MLWVYTLRKIIVSFLTYVTFKNHPFSQSEILEISNSWFSAKDTFDFLVEASIPFLASLICDKHIVVYMGHTGPDINHWPFYFFSLL